MTKVFLLIAIIFFVSAAVPAQSLLELQQADVEKLTKSTDLLRQLHSEGLVARIELEKAEQELSSAKTRVEETQKARELTKKAEELAKANPTVKSLVKPTLMALNKTGTVIRSTGGSWSLTNLGTVQQFFSKTFGRPLPSKPTGVPHWPASKRISSTERGRVASAVMSLNGRETAASMWE
jgi:hypothetical protein